MRRCHLAINCCSEGLAEVIPTARAARLTMNREGIAGALAVPRSDLRLFGKPEAFKKRRRGWGKTRRHR